MNSLRRVKDRLAGGAALIVDRAATFAVELQTRGRVRIAVSHAARRAFLERLLEEYGDLSQQRFFAEPEAIAPALRRVSRRDSRIFDAGWPSACRPYLSEFSERYLETRENHVAWARLFLASKPRPIVIVIHGYMSGNFAVEERIWPLPQLSALGFDVALFVLPFHGLRAKPELRLAPEFPGSDPRRNIEGFRQAVFDLRSLVRFLKERGHPRVGLFGMSLGGYTAALTATVESNVDFLVPLVPLACLADFAREQGSLSETPQQAALEYELLERLYRPVSPVFAEPRVRSDRVLVIGGRADRVTPIGHARRIANHFSAPLVAFPGGHLLQFGRRETFDRVFSLLERIRDEATGPGE
jgi:pimeloyl-ACP methyl ester carboxylesterase